LALFKSGAFSVLAPHRGAEPLKRTSQNAPLGGILFHCPFLGALFSLREI